MIARVRSGRALPLWCRQEPAGRSHGTASASFAGGQEDKDYPSWPTGSVGPARDADPSTEVPPGDVPG
jgi:hypothetical protein